MENSLLTIVLLNEVRINSMICSVYGLSSHDYQMVEKKMGKPVGSLPVSKEAKDAFDEMLAHSNGLNLESDGFVYVLNSLQIADSVPQISDFESLYQSNKGKQRR